MGVSPVDDTAKPDAMAGPLDRNIAPPDWRTFNVQRNGGNPQSAARPRCKSKISTPLTIAEFIFSSAGIPQAQENESCLTLPQ